MKSFFLMMSGALLAAFASCSDPQVHVVEANPDLMHDLSRKRTGEIVIKPSGPEKTAQTAKAAIQASRLRLPDMESLPSEKELESQPASPSGGEIIARPPSE